MKMSFGRNHNLHLEYFSDIYRQVIFLETSTNILYLNHNPLNVLASNISKLNYYLIQVGLGGLGVTCSSREPRFAGSNPTEVDGFLHNVKILSTSPPEGTLSWGSRV